MTDQDIEEGLDDLVDRRMRGILDSEEPRVEDLEIVRKWLNDTANTDGALEELMVSKVLVALEDRSSKALELARKYTNDRNRRKMYADIALEDPAEAAGKHYGIQFEGPLTVDEVMGE